MEENLFEKEDLDKLENPFENSSIESVSLFYHPKKEEDPEWDIRKCRGYIEFKKGNTTGKQEFSGSSIKEVLTKMIGFCDSEIK